MKTVIIGDGESIFIKEHIADVCKPVFSEILLLSTSYSDNDFYLNLGVEVKNVGYTNEESNMSKDERKKSATNRWNGICEGINDIDVLQVHYCAGGERMYCYKALAPKSKKSYMVYWGSDIFRTDDYNIQLNRSAIEMSDGVIALTESLKNALLLKYGDLLKYKVEAIDFGASFEDIRVLSQEYSSSECKKMCGFPENKLSVMIGYNANVAQQHLNVLDALSGLDKKILDKVFLFFPMSYGQKDEQYIREVKKRVSELPVEHGFIDCFLERKDLVIMRLATDVFINAQITDALSSSMCECFYAGVDVVNPKWIDYPELRRENVFRYEYKDFKELSKLIKDVINNVGNHEYKLRENKEKIWNINERGRMIERWKSLFLRT